MKYPAKAHAKRVALKFTELTGIREFALFQSAAQTVYWSHSDQTIPFRQNRYFNYITGAYDLADAYVVYDTASDNLTLYLPPVNKDDVMWSGMPLLPEEALDKFDVDFVKYGTHIRGDLKDLASHGPVFSVDSASFPEIRTSAELLHAFDESRMIKDVFELSLMRKACEITDKAHLAVMESRNMQSNEGHVHAEFLYSAMRDGSKHQAYDPICCSGTNCGTLHYVKNDEDFGNRQLLLIDAGAEWQAYASDVTRVFPLNGEWTREARNIYDLVLDMQLQTMQRIKPGVLWDELHLLAHRILIRHFLKLGIFQGADEEEILESNISAAFYPHGLGHMLGMDTHDTGGLPNYSDTDPKLKYLRIRRRLAEHMVVTVEPGCYFSRFLLEPYQASNKYINHNVLARYMSVGGVRIEDDVLVTRSGYECLTKVTKNADEISQIIKKSLEKQKKIY